jgi:hypothetical protein
LTMYFATARLSDFKAELEQLAMDTRGAPQRIVQRSSAGSARAGPRRLADGLQGSGISNASIAAGPVPAHESPTFRRNMIS